MKVGKNFGRNEHCIMDNFHCWLIEIGDNVTFAPCVYILAHDARMNRVCGYTEFGTVHIGNNVFLGVGVIVLHGVHIGNNVVVGAVGACMTFPVIAWQ